MNLRRAELGGWTQERSVSLPPILLAFFEVAQPRGRAIFAVGDLQPNLSHDRIKISDGGERRAALALRLPSYVRSSFL
jgi:hypothetical protein